MPSIDFMFRFPEVASPPAVERSGDGFTYRRYRLIEPFTFIYPFVSWVESSSNGAITHNHYLYRYGEVGFIERFSFLNEGADAAAGLDRAAEFRRMIESKLKSLGLEVSAGPAERFSDPLGFLCEKPGPRKR